MSDRITLEQGRERMSLGGDSLRGEVVDEEGRAPAHGQEGIALYLRVGRQDALCQPRDDGLGQGQVLAEQTVSEGVDGREPGSAAHRPRVRPAFDPLRDQEE